MELAEKNFIVDTLKACRELIEDKDIVKEINACLTILNKRPARNRPYSPGQLLMQLSGPVVKTYDESSVDGEIIATLYVTFNAWRSLEDNYGDPNDRKEYIFYENTVPPAESDLYFNMIRAGMELYFKESEPNRQRIIIKPSF